MTGRRADGRSRPKEALRRFGFSHAVVRRIPRGLVSWHWAVRIGDRRFVLRRYNPWREGIAYEHEVLHHLDHEGWPVAAPVPDAKGETVVEIDEDRYALFPFLPGRLRTTKSRDFAEARGRLLAQLHRTLEPLNELGQRVGSTMMHDFATHPNAPNGRSFLEVLPVFEKSFPDLGSRLREHTLHLAPKLADLSSLPRTIVHGDFGKWNLLFERSSLVGIVDFDFTRLDLRMADVAISTRFEEKPLWSRFVQGYVAEAKLSDPEFDAFVPLRLARGFVHAAPNLAWWETGRDDLVAEVEIALRELDRDRADEDQLRRAIDAFR